MDGMKAEACMGRRTLKGVVSHQDGEVAELAADPELTIANLKAAMEALDNPDERDVAA
jgi:hypothetical protein